MTQGEWKRILGVCLLASASFLAACGGGGGGGGSDGGGGGASPPPTGGSSGTGLVPAAPVAGPVIVADSAALRPLAAGLRWQYRQFTPLVGPFENEVILLPGTGGRVIERTGGDPGNDVELSRNAEGQTLNTLTLPLGNGRTLSIGAVELPRELRAGQQFTTYDARVEGIDIALWRVVVGFEDILTPASVTPVRALRIDDRGTLRSGTGGASQLEQLYGSTWYLPDVGVVRSVEWTDASRSVSESDERLLGFEGVNRGFGVVKMPRVAPVSGAAVLADGYVARGAGSGETIVADRNGRELATGNFVRAPESPSQARLLPTAAGVRVVTPVGSGFGTSFALDALDATGRLSGERLATLPLQSDDAALRADFNVVRVTSHHASNVIWMVFIEQTQAAGSSPLDLLVVQRFDSSGQSLGSRQQWELTGSIGRALLQVEALPDGLLVLLPQGGSLSPARLRWLEFSNAGDTRRDRDYRVSEGLVPNARVVVDGDARWLAWAAGDGLPRAWRLGPDGAPVGVAETVDAARAAVVPLPASVHAEWPRNLVAAGGRWTLSGTDFAPLTGETPTATNLARPHAVLAIFNPGEGDIRNQPAPGLIRVDTGSLGAAIRFSDRTVWEAGVVQWR